MSSEGKTREQLVEDLNEARRLIAELEKALDEARRSLEEYENRIHIHSQLSNDIFFSYDNTLKVLSVTPNVKRITGYDPAELIGKNFSDLQFIVHPEDVDEALDSANHMLSGKTRYSNIYRFLTKDGQKRFAEAEGVPVLKGDKVVAMVSRASDITRHVEMEQSLRKSEESCRATLQRIPDAIAIYRCDDLRIMYTNDSFTRLTGYSSEESVGRNISDLALISPVTGDGLFGKFCKASQEVSRNECRCTRKDGTCFDALISWNTLQYRGEDCMVMVMTDISSVAGTRHGTEEIDTRFFQEQKLDAVRTLSSGIAHDFNNILTAILGYTRMATRDVSNALKGSDDVVVIRDDLNEVRRAAIKARDLVNQLLLFGRHTHRKYEPVDLSGTVGESLKMLRSIMPADIDVQDNLECEGLVLGDPILVHQAVVNLCTNAMHAMAGRGGVMELSVERVSIDNETGLELDLPSGSYLRLRVRDTGPGMNHKTRQRIFEPYFTTRTKGMGTGLGLSVVHGIAKEHGGTVICTSRTGGGTVFDLYLPEISSDAEGLAAMLEAANTRGNETILVIDDEPTVAGQVNRALENLGYTVVTMNRGKEALEHFRKNPSRYDLVIADMGMPDMGGEVLAKKLSEIREDIPIIGCSVKGNHLSGEGMKASGMKECIVKPVEVRGLARTVRKVLDRERRLSGED